MSKYKIIMTGGGTAGHVTPNLALVPKLKEKDFEIKYIGSYEGIEKEIIGDAGIPYYSISSGKLRRYFDMKNFSDPFKVMKGVLQASKILSKEKPDVITSRVKSKEISNYNGVWGLMQYQETNFLSMLEYLYDKTVVYWFNNKKMVK